MERKVTRTVTVTTANVMVCNTETGLVTPMNYELTGEVKDNKQALKQLNKVYGTESLIFVKVLSVESKETLYGMSESDFIKYAKPLDKRTDKV